jgi:hypothetical protein
MAQLTEPERQQLLAALAKVRAGVTELANHAAPAVRPRHKRRPTPSWETGSDVDSRRCRRHPGKLRVVSDRCRRPSESAHRWPSPTAATTRAGDGLAPQERPRAGDRGRGRIKVVPVMFGRVFGSSVGATIAWRVRRQRGQSVWGPTVCRTTPWAGSFLVVRPRAEAAGSFSEGRAHHGATSSRPPPNRVS